MDKKTKMYSVGYATFSLASFSMSSHVVNKTYSTQWIKKSYPWTPRLMCIVQARDNTHEQTGGPRRETVIWPPSPEFPYLFPSLCVILCDMLHIKVEVVERKIVRSICGHTTGWTVRGSNPGGGEIFRTCPDRPWGPPSLLYNGHRVYRGVKSGRGVTLTPHPLLVPWSWKGRAIPLLPLWAVRSVQSLSACTRVTFTFTFTIYWKKKAAINKLFCCVGVWLFEDETDMHISWT